MKILKAIVTVRLRDNPIRRALGHDPRNKKRGNCPILKNKLCTDITGEHHSYLGEGKDEAEIRKMAQVKGFHVTRIEVIEE